MPRKPKPIRAGRKLKKNEIELNIFDFERDPNIIRNYIDSHIEKGECKNCKWSITVSSESVFQELEIEGKPCLLKIFTEIAPKPHFDIYKNKYELKFLSEEGAMNFVISVFCEPIN